ncbi:YegP family protein [Pseudarthrobacter sp. S9]|uniref:YegP family protein n=1 Tax=Pseudarthrobacter sp. S9 TaxID=3418421 RepID=UPI003CFEC729
MAGTFELFVDADAFFRFRLKAPDGTVMAVSKAFEDKPAAVAGINAVREYAGMGLISDLCPAAARSNAPAVGAHEASTKAGDGRRIRANDLRVRASAPRRAGEGQRWIGAA